MICFNGNTTVNVETDPLNPDSNADGIRDGDEFDRGVCRFTERGDRPSPGMMTMTATACSMTGPLPFHRIAGLWREWRELEL